MICAQDQTLLPANTYLKAKAAFYYYEEHNELPSPKGPVAKAEDTYAHAIKWIEYSVTHILFLLILVGLFFQRRLTRQYPQGSSPLFWALALAFSGYSALIYLLMAWVSQSTVVFYPLFYFVYYAIYFWLAFGIYRVCRKRGLSK